MVTRQSIEIKIASGLTLTDFSDSGKAHFLSQLEEQVMNQGMAFLSGLYKMSRGKDAGFVNSKVVVDKETGEVVVRFKMPKFQ